MASVADLLARLAGVVLPDEWLGPNGEAHAEHMQRSWGAAVVDYMSSGVSLAGAQSAAVVATLLREHRMTSAPPRLCITRPPLCPHSQPTTALCNRHRCARAAI